MFRQKLENTQNKNKSVLCVGLDSDVTRLPKSVLDKKEPIYEFNCQIIDSTAPYVCAYKPNIAFYEAEGPSGLEALKKSLGYLHNKYPNIPVILDAKRADIGNTNTGYTKLAFDYLQVDAITVHPYLGREALEPFLEYKDKGVIILCRTSNPGAGEFQDLVDDNNKPLYKTVASQIASKWNTNDNCSIVAGATYPKELAEIREIVGNMVILIPGIGAQGGDVEKTIKAGAIPADKRDKKFSAGIIINSSRGIIFASAKSDFAEAAGESANKLCREINKYI